MTSEPDPEEMVLTWQFYRKQAIGYQKLLRLVEMKISIYWTAALDAADGDKRAAWYVTNIGMEDTPEGFEYSSLKGERILLLKKIQAATAMSTMLYMQDRGES